MGDVKFIFPFRALYKIWAKYSEAKRKAPIIILESRNNLRRNSKAFFAKNFEV
jgi:hypothetical protein